MQSPLYFKTQRDFQSWLSKNHAKSEGIWIQFLKKAEWKKVPLEFPNQVHHEYSQALDVALCYGWIDGTRKALNAQYYIQRFTPRRPKSQWSQINCAKAEKLIIEKRMRTPGLKAIEAAKADGRWQSAYASQSKIEVPNDFLAELKKVPKALEFFKTLKGSKRYAFLYRLHSAKKSETRAKRLKQYVEMLKNAQTFY